MSVSATNSSQGPTAGASRRERAERSAETVGLPGDRLTRSAGPAWLASRLTASPAAAAALQRLARDGRLDGPLLEALEALARSRPVPPLRAAQLLADAVQDVERPSRIWQGYHRTCAATVVQQQVARERPAEYVRIVTGLASGEGEVALAGRGTLRRVPGSERAHLIDARTDDGRRRRVTDPRTAVSRLFQSAAMELANGSERSYDPRRDEHLGQGPADHGLNGEEGIRLAQALGLAGDHVPAYPVQLYAGLDEATTRLNQADGVRAAARREAAAADAAYAAALARRASKRELAAADQRRTVADQALTAANAAYDRAWSQALRYVRLGEVGPARFVDAIARELAAGRAVRASVQLPEEPDLNHHAVLVTAVDARHVTFDDPRGRAGTRVSRAQFEAMVRGAELPRGWNAPPADG